MSPPRPASLLLGLGGAVTAISSAALFILLAQPLPSSVIAAGRVAVTGIVLLLLGARALPVAWAGLRQPGVPVRVALAAALLAVHFGTWVASLSLTTVPRSVTLVATQPLFAGILGRLVGDRAPWALYGGAGLAVVGTLLMVGGELGTGELGTGGLGGGAAAGGAVASGEGAVPVGFNLGDGLAVIAAAAAAGYLVVGRSVGERLPLRPYLGLVHLGAAGLLGAVAVAFEPTLLPAWVGLEHLGAVLYLGLVPGVVGHGLLNWAVRRVPVHVVALAILFEPIGATVLTVLVLGQAVGVAEAIGAGVLLLGVGLGLPRRRL